MREKFYNSEDDTEIERGDGYSDDYEEDTYEDENYYDMDNDDEDSRHREPSKYRLASEYDDMSYFNEDENENLDENETENAEDDDYDEEYEEYDGSATAPYDYRLNKRGSKAEKRDMSGSAVRARFFQIMEDYHSGNPAKRTLALENAMRELEGFIHLIIKRSYSTYTKKHFYDLLQEGYLGVAIGMEKYDPNISMPSTFFFPYIKHEMQGFITRNVDKTTSHYAANIKKINKAIQELEEKGVRYTNVDIALQTGMTIETVDQSMAIRNYRDEVHIDACPPNVIDAELNEQRYKTPEQEIIEAETSTAIYRAIAMELTDDEAKVLELHFGLNGTEPVSEGEIAKRMSIPKDKVKRLLNRGIRKLRQSDLSNMFSDNLKKDNRLLEETNIALIPREATQSDIDFLTQLDIFADD